MRIMLSIKKQQECHIPDKDHSTVKYSNQAWNSTRKASVFFLQPVSLLITHVLIRLFLYPELCYRVSQNLLSSDPVC